MLPSLIIDNLPQQEIYNKEYMIKHNLAKGVTKHSLTNELISLLNDPDQLEKMRESCKKIRSVNSTEKMCDVLKNCK